MNSKFLNLKFNIEFTITCPYERKSIGRPGSKSCVILVPFIDRCGIIGHFRVPLSLSFKANLSAKFLLW